MNREEVESIIKSEEEYISKTNKKLPLMPGNEYHARFNKIIEAWEKSDDPLFNSQFRLLGGSKRYTNKRGYISKIIKKRNNRFKKDELFLHEKIISIDDPTHVLNEAEKLLAKSRGYTWGTMISIQLNLAAISAGIAIELSLKLLCEKVNINHRIRQPTNITELKNLLKEEEEISDTESENIENWVKTRNKAAHGSYHAINFNEVEIMIYEASQFINKHFNDVKIMIDEVPQFANKLNFQ